MVRTKTVFVCQKCGHIAPKWEGKCSACGTWNTLIEEVQEVTKNKSSNVVGVYHNSPTPILDITKKNIHRINLPLKEFERVLGGGLVPGSLVLLGGEPGVGKSTLILQIAVNISKNVLYISGEESDNQIKMRADRIGVKNELCSIYNETNIEKIVQTVKKDKPEIVIIDSIQTVFSQDLTSAPGTISQIRECARQLQVYAKNNSVPVIIIGHINKDGEIAGPMVLEHIVDTVLQFEGDSNHFYRLLRPKKNRFGSTYEIGVFEMKSDGLSEINDPGNILLTNQTSRLSGVAYGTLGEGARTLMLEVQALTGAAVFSSPQRSATGFDNRRFQMLLAVIEKRLGLKLAQKDVFLNIAGGIRVSDTAVDLAVVASVISSYFDKIIPENTCFIGEVGLSGQVRPVSHIDKRVGEAVRLGFNRLILSKSQQKDIIQTNAELIFADDINAFVKQLF